MANAFVTVMGIDVTSPSRIDRSHRHEVHRAIGICHSAPTAIVIEVFTPLVSLLSPRMEIITAGICLAILTLVNIGIILQRQ